jgi:Domain of unknown function DUF29
MASQKSTGQISKPNISTIYDKDYYLWIETTAKQLQERKFLEIDIDNLVEEIESMGRSEKSALKSNLVVVLIHLLKWQYQSSLRSNSWKSSIREHRRRLRDALQDSPSLKPYLIEVFGECYQDAREQAADETGLPLESFPVIPLLSSNETLNSDFLPE